MPQLTMPLGADGCTVTLYVCVSAECREVLANENKPIPEFVGISAILDTGASCTAIDAEKWRHWELRRQE